MGHTERKGGQHNRNMLGHGEYHAEPPQFSDDANFRKIQAKFKFACPVSPSIPLELTQLTPIISVPLEVSESPSREQQRGIDLGEGQGEGQPIGPVLTRSAAPARKERPTFLKNWLGLRRGQASSTARFMPPDHFKAISAR